MPYHMRLPLPDFEWKILAIVMAIANNNSGLGRIPTGSVAGAEVHQWHSLLDFLLRNSAKPVPSVRAP